MRDPAHLFVPPDEERARAVVSLRYVRARFWRDQIHVHHTSGADYPFPMMTREA